MAASIQEFHTELFEQHLEEASFLYEQRIALFDDPELSWRDLGDFEERFEAHIDALVVGGELALTVCKTRCSAGDFGELHAALRVFCRQGQPELVYAVLQGIDPEDTDVARAVIDALKFESPESWHDGLTRVLLGSRKELIPIVASVLAYRRAPIEDALLRALPTCPAARAGHAVWALGRVGSDKSCAALEAYLKAENAEIAATACRSLIRLGNEQAIRNGLLIAQMKPWPLLSLGIGGGRTAVNVLTDIVKSSAVSSDAILALGLLGDLASVATIFQCLSNADCAVAAATALQTITGAALYEDIFVADVVDPEELIEEEREEYEQTGKVPMRPDGQPNGSSVSQISINPDSWRVWLSAHKAHFDPKLRYRQGKPHSPASLLECLCSEHTPGRIRALVCDELVVRYRAPVSLEIDMPVRRQMDHLAALAAWVRESEGKFKPGIWYFAGQPMDWRSGS